MSFEFTLTNVGGVPANFSLQFQEQSIRLSPLTGVLELAEMIKIHGIFCPKTVDVFDSEILIDCKDSVEPISPIKFIASSLNNSLSFLFNNQPVQNLDFLVKNDQ